MTAISRPEYKREHGYLSRFAFQPMQGVHELGDMDDPLNAWMFGQRDELFKYRLLGSHKTQSGQRDNKRQRQMGPVAFLVPRLCFNSFSNAHLA